MEEGDTPHNLVFKNAQCLKALGVSRGEAQEVLLIVKQSSSHYVLVGIYTDKNTKWPLFY